MLTLKPYIIIFIVYIAYIATRSKDMTGTSKRSRFFLDLEPELRNRFKAVAALQGKTMKEWLTEAIIAKLEDEIDAADGLVSLADTEGTISLEAYLKSRKNRNNQTD